MIQVHKLNGQSIVVNAELLETVEAHGAETVLHLVTGNRIVVTESIDVVVGKVVEYRKTVYATSVYVPEYLKREETRR